MAIPAETSVTYALPNICLPVFLRVQIDGYEMFPGRDGNGLHHDFASGITAIVGINGIGKTTLLNVMLRILVGPFNPEKVTPFEVGAKSHDLVRWQQRSYFSARVTDEASSATAYAEVRIGAHTLKIRRRLADLAITFLDFDTQELEPTEEEFERVVVDASNASSRYDFDFLVRYLVFFLEQRVPLFWNERGQVETFRILLCDAVLADAFQRKQDEIQELDSQFRNLRWPANKRVRDLERWRARLANASTIDARILAMQEEYRAYATKDAEIVAAIGDSALERSKLRTQLFLVKIELEEARRAFEGMQQTYLAAIFPDVDASARHIFSTLVSHTGCIVCGNRGPRGVERLEKLLSKGDCPVCESPSHDQERKAIEPPPKRQDMELAVTEITRLQRAVDALTANEQVNAAKLKSLSNERNTIQSNWGSVRVELDKLNAAAPVTPEQLKALESQVEAEQEQLRKMQANLQGLYVEYEALIEQVRLRVQDVSEKVRTLFQEYASSFLAERCYLGLASYTENVGQDRRFEYPCFNVYMTSATSPNRETIRRSEEEVSESQREFIDLAFRMALIGAVASGARAMLIIETPEANLDTYFVEQAGALLRQFAEQKGEAEGNVVIVSSNLNQQNMLGALLGFAVPEGQWPGAEKVEKHVINMLRESRENAALREHRDRYEEALATATKGRLSARVA